MRIKKGFTLAEILIVLMVIGVIATMTIPSLMRGVTEQQWKTGYNKAYNTISNLAAMERVAGNLAGTATNSARKFFESMVGSLNVREYISNDVNGGVIPTNNDYRTAVKFTSANGAETTIGSGQNALTFEDNGKTWIVTEDNLAYTVIQGTNGNGNRCATKQEILAFTTEGQVPNACTYVVVDVNGISAGPNILEPQGNTGSTLKATTGLQPLVGDRYYIFVGLDGATSGNKGTTVTGRITAGLK